MNDLQVFHNDASYGDYPDGRWYIYHPIKQYLGRDYKFYPQMMNGEGQYFQTKELAQEALDDYLINHLEKYTVIYSFYFQTGCHTNQITRMIRVNKKQDELWSDCVGRYNLDMSQVTHIFEGWPKMDGETEEIVESKPVQEN
jgi:hypothetical protein